ncbi:hypothetical protein FACS1894158_12260 [Betaproteobacteria bacterium]|nr:hypothetical protein FACS1894158_12260 [Betaproteobacteria bacterium]
MCGKIMLMKKQTKFVSSIFGSLSSTGRIFSRPNYPRPCVVSDVERMRGDWVRIGGDFNKVIARENGKANRKAA